MSSPGRCRSLILIGFEWDVLGRGFLVVAASAAMMIALSVRLMNDYD